MDPHRFARSPLRLIAAFLGFPALGASVGYGLLVAAVLPAFGLGTVERIAAIGRHLQQPLPPSMTVFLGSSIVREGIDAGALNAGPAENLAISGCGWTEFRAIAPLVIQARPATVVLGLYPLDATVTPAVELDKAFAYAVGGFARAWPEAWKSPEAWDALDAETFEAFTSTRLKQQLHFRTLPLTMMENAVRRRTRTTIRAITPTNFVDPYELATSVRDERLAWHLDSVGASVRKTGTAPSPAAVAQLREAVAQLRSGGAKTMLVLLPVHPGLANELAPTIAHLRAEAASLAEAGGVRVVDAVELLGAEAFADALHPNALGRMRLSRFVGEALDVRTGTSVASHPPEAR